MPDLQAVGKTLDEHNQGHLLAFFDELGEPARAALLEQLAAVDWDRLEGWIEQYVRNKPEVSLPAKIDPPNTVCPRSADEALASELDAARQLGTELIAEGKVAAFVVAGGQGTRLGYEGPKGCYEGTPVAKKPLFRVFAEQILAASKRHRVRIPWYVMTSPTNHVATQAFFRQNAYFGLDDKDVFFFQQGTMPAIGLDGKLLLAEKGRLAVSPDGHGGCLTAMRKSGALEDLADRDIDLISYFQVDNPLVRVLDPLFLGLHAMRNAEMSAKALPKKGPKEKLGNFCLVDGKVTVIEYSDLPDELAEATTADGHLRFSAGSIAIHVLSRTFVERLTVSGQADLPWHRAEKKVPYVDATGQVVQPGEPNAVKLEKFVFDALPLARETVILETERSEEFSPIKNADGDDSPRTSLRDQVRRAATWIEEAGIAVPRDADGQIAAALEISPLFADCPEELRRKIDPSLTISPGQNLYLGSSKAAGA